MRSMYLKSFTFLTVVGLSSAMAFGQAAVDTLKSRLVNQPVTVKMEGLRISRGVLFKAVDIRIQDGVIQKRMFSTNANTDEVLNPGDKVRVTKVEAASDKKNDFLRLTIAAADGPTVPVAFVFPKGALATQDESQLEQVIGTTFDLASAGTPAMQPIAPPPPPPEESGATGRRGASGMPVWQIRATSQGGKEAYLSGSLNAGGSAGSVLLGLSCLSFTDPSNPPQLTAELRVHSTDKLVKSTPDCMTDSGTANAQISLDGRPEAATSVCYTANAPDEKVMSITTSLPYWVVDDMLATSASSLNMQLFGSDPQTRVTADFQLPQDPSGARTLLDTCIESGKRIEKSGPPGSVLACPYEDGKGLRSADIVTATGKSYVSPPIPDDDGTSGKQFLMPRATKARPVPPKLTLVCSYGNGRQKTADGESLETKKLPIPSTAKLCVVSGSPELGSVTATCSK